MIDATNVTSLRCEYLVDPLGIDETEPRLSWLMDADRRGARQTALRVQVASTREQLSAGHANLWDSGRVDSDQSCQIVYAGIPLIARMACHWQVTIWDEIGQVATSDPALWTMGLLDLSDWHGHWITHDPEIIRRDAQAFQATEVQPGTPPLFRREFNLPSSVRRATLYATARGVVDMAINGLPVTCDRLVPEWTDYHKRLHCRTYDITDFLVEGPNSLGAILGDGWWSGYVGWQERRGAYRTLQNSILLQLEIELENGETVCISTDHTWRCETGPILFSDIMMGETYDARRERDGWDRAAYEDSTWLPAIEVEPPMVRVPQFGFSNNQAETTAKLLPLVAQPSEPVRVVETIRPVSVNEVQPGVYIYDLGQNIAGWVELSISGPEGTRLELRHGERLNPDGTLYTDNLRRAKAADRYILKGTSNDVSEETWQPRFTFHGFQYIELTGLTAALPLDKIRGCVVMSSTAPTGEFECSNPLVNRLWKNAWWGQKGNFLSVPTDCPQRDERLGWMGDAQVFLRTATYNMDVAAFFTKWMIDVADSQDVDGVFPDVAPRIAETEEFVGLDGLGGGVGWADAGVIIPWTIWQVYGDTRIIERHWLSMVKWLDWLEATNPSGIRGNALNNNYGDWLCIPADTTFRTQSEMKTLLATAYWADDAAKLSQMARELGQPEDAKRFQEMASRIHEAFQGRWLLDDGRLSVETQTAYVLALTFNLLPDDIRERSAEHLVEQIKRNDWHLNTGFIGISHLNPALTLTGHADVAYQLLANEDYPSWLYPIIHGATTIWERWNGWTEQQGFFDPQMNSFNHYSLGSVSEWLYRHVAGIELDPDSPGFKQFIVKPYVNGALDHAGAKYHSVHGTIESDWEVKGDSLRLRVGIPANTRARVFVPCLPDCTVWEGGQPADRTDGINDLGRHDGFRAFAVGSGRYEFLAPRQSSGDD